MLNKIFRTLITLAGILIGMLSAYGLKDLEFINGIMRIQGSTTNTAIFSTVISILFGIIFYLLSPFIINLITSFITSIEGSIQRIPTGDIISGLAGLIVGLVLANLLVSSFIKFLSATPLLSVIGTIISAIVNIVCGVLGIKIAMKKKGEFARSASFLKKFTREKKPKEKTPVGATPKVLDTSVIIDGRIFDILKTGFVEGTIVIPSFVLEELRHIADSSDSLKRTRGRRGLDLLNQIQKELPIKIEISEKDFPSLQEVDTKLLKLAEEVKGKVITNDFNLNKVAEFQGVPVLNINELSNAIKPVVIPGEEMHLSIVKDGKESGQGVSYLDDGTMIVVEGGKRHLGEDVDVIVTSVLQTAAGRMIFAKMK
ncbi:PIN/TRAM domain-containing protein [Clostridium cylindrosporum]|uniref:Putative PIN and TRAM-domain containing protein YacL n=1 Tax=Clostridium cylindrosporum DSM 605 TaxID=1121307 RepID=A0A0J8DDY2_CLOCY|nr:PIN/TRAM domain-containing protein [Clostridium cylindrosporum]KMT22428.1 putative PIN and TRAM-domain containing protein YacL [Clostridium cylindrosporum DSM 605]